ncbi:MAG: ClbS/DfsB family four-helix bundle protein [Chloroflexota bacterium]|nr:ClbS/DfsB family four-helix bundle protein [Chloroflexota bacterium]
MNKEELLHNIRSERATLDALIATIDDRASIAPALEGDRSVKDVLAHITAWEQRCASKIREGSTRDVSAAEEASDGGFTEADMHRFNESVFEANRARPLVDVREDARRSYQAMLAAVGALSEEQLGLPVRWGSTEGPLMLEFIREDTDAHYREHSDQIEAWRRQTQ